MRQLSHEELAALIRPSGYYRAKASKLKALARFVGGHGDDLADLFSEATPGLREKLLEVHGIGEETADSILLYAARRPVFVVDAYTRRIFSRLGLGPGGTSTGTGRVSSWKTCPSGKGCSTNTMPSWCATARSTARRSPAVPSAR